MVFVAEGEDWSVVGSLTLVLRETEPGPGGVEHLAPFLSSMYVDPACRRRGVATRLIREALAWCKERGFRYVTGLPVHHAPEVLRRLGFRVLQPEMGIVLSGREPD